MELRIELSILSQCQYYKLMKSQTTNHRKRSCFICITCAITCQPSSMNKDGSNLSKPSFG